MRVKSYGHEIDVDASSKGLIEVSGAGSFQFDFDFQVKTLGVFPILSTPTVIATVSEVKRSLKKDYKLGYEFAGEVKDITTLDGAVVSGVWIQTSEGIDVSGQAPTIQFDTGFCSRPLTVDASGKIGLAYNSGTRDVANVDLWKSGIQVLDVKSDECEWKQ